MKVLKNSEILQSLYNTNKMIFIWGCSNATKELLVKNKIQIDGIIDNNDKRINNSFFEQFNIINANKIDGLDNSIIIVHGNHCKSIFNQLKSIKIKSDIDIVFDFDNGGEKIFDKKLYFNVKYDELKNFDSLDTLYLTTIDREKFTNNGGNILISYEEAKNIIPWNDLISYKLKFLNKYVNNNKIYIGCGEDYRDGYLHCDKRELPHIDIVCNAWEINNKIKNLTNIYSRHMLEHLTEREAYLTLTNWFDSLVENGELELIVPNFDLRARQWLNCDWNEDSYPTKDEKWAFAGCWGWQRECDPMEENYNQSYWDVHKSGYNEKRIKVILKKIGFIDIKTKIDEKNNLITVAYKR